MIKTKLKGGSLSATYLCEHNGNKFIRKEVSTTDSREYGFVRWYSQLKKLQRMSKDFSNLFPKILNVSIEQNTAYFDIEYFTDFVDLKTFLCSAEISAVTLEKIVTQVFNSLSILHAKTYHANTGAAKLYYSEEVIQKIADAIAASTDFADFYNIENYQFHGEEINGIQQYLPLLEKFFSTFNLTSECYIHGNPTLENIMYSPSENIVKFIDLYEEGIIDCCELDFSQILQCSHSYYGFINDNYVSVYNNIVFHNLIVPQSLQDFNKIFENKLSNFDMRILRIFEATQFIRMLPFKCAAGDIIKAKYFYTHACYLLGKCFNESR
jgi:hypothetical protein